MKKLTAISASQVVSVSEDYIEWLDDIASRYNYTVFDYDPATGVITFKSTGSSAHLMPVLYGTVNPDSRWLDFKFKLYPITEDDLTYASSLEWLFSEWADDAGKLYTALTTDEHAKAW